jgi:phosphotransferase family enzyme
MDSDAGHDDEEIPLAGGRSTTGVVRVGDTVRRSVGPWTTTVHAFLAHLRARGFTGVPRPLGFDEQGREVLEFIDGDVLAVPQDPVGPVVLGRWPDPVRSDDALIAAGELVRRLHDASHGFTTDEANWRLHDQPMRPGEIVCHGDLAPWNAVYRDGRPVAFIDFDSARPDDPLRDLASAAWHFVPLTDDETARALGFDDVDHAGRLIAFLDAYGLSDRRGFLEALRAVRSREAAYPHFWKLGPEDAAGHLEHVASQLRWLASKERDLDRALSRAARSAS